jgi:hypothetical protein
MAQGSVKLAAALALGVGLAACSTPSAPPASQIAPAPAASKPSPSPRPPPPASARAAAATDLCGASALQWLVGKPRTEIPVPVEPSRRRVVCTTCEITPENVPFRQTIVYDLGSGLVTAVRCG